MYSILLEAFYSHCAVFNHGQRLGSSLGFQEIAQVIVITDSLISSVVMTQQFA